MVACSVVAAAGWFLVAPRLHGPVIFTAAAAAAIAAYAGIVWLLDGAALVRALSIVPREATLSPSTPAPALDAARAPSPTPLAAAQGSPSLP